MAAKAPPRYVPTLTEVVKPVVREPAPGSGPLFSEEQLVHRVLQRVDLQLERRLREAVATVVLEHTRALEPALRAEIELVVRATVSDALAEEFGPQGSPGQPRA